jgi:hypothetical protein
LSGFVDVWGNDLMHGGSFLEGFSWMMHEDLTGNSFDAWGVQLSSCQVWNWTFC